MSFKLPSNVNKSMKSLSNTKLFKNNIATNIALFVVVALTLGYFANRNYQAVIFLYIFAFAIYMFCKNLFCALVSTIIVTNLLITMDYFKISESFKEGKNHKNPAKKTKETKNTKEERKVKKVKANPLKELTEQLNKFKK